MGLPAKEEYFQLYEGDTASAVDVSAFVCTQNGAMPVLPREYTE